MARASTYGARQSAIRRWGVGQVEMPLAVIGCLPRNLSSLGHDELRDARRDRDERMTVLFRRWASLSKDEFRELRKLSDERQRLARHGGNVRHLRALRTL